MKGLELADVLRMFRSIEEDTDAIPVLGDDEAMRVLSAWRKTDQKWARPRSKMPTMQAGNHQAVWQWVCSGWTIDYRAIERGADLSARVVHVKMGMLISARLIYPDGEISKAARAALQLHVAQKLGIKPKRQTKKKSDDTSEGESN